MLNTPFLVSNHNHSFPSLVSIQAKSTGRGGVGNIRSNSHSRSQSRVPGEGQPQNETINEEGEEGLDIQRKATQEPDVNQKRAVRAAYLFSYVTDS